MKWAFDEIMVDAMAEGVTKGLAEGMAKWLAEGWTEDWAKGWAEGWTKGWVEGWAKGQRNKAIEIARNMKKLGRSLDDIAMCVNLPLSEIQALE